MTIHRVVKGSAFNMEVQPLHVAFVIDPAINIHYHVEGNLVTGPVLIPGWPLHPSSGQELIFSKYAVINARAGFSGVFTLGHEGKAKGVELINSWIVQNPGEDLLGQVGITAPRGTWALQVKVKDPLLLVLVSKAYQGFSVEGYLKQ